MDTRKRLYKATTNTLTLTERVKKDRSRQNVTRNNKFNANRNIHVDLDDSVNTPPKPTAIKVSQIKDKPAKLKAYIEQKRTNKLKEQLEQRSPFIPYVPCGRWVEKKEPVRKPKAFTISTPVRKALMSDGKILKKSTIKQIATTAKKENLGPANKSKQNEPVKSRKKILMELNNVQQQPEVVKPAEILLDKIESPQILDETFELVPSEVAEDPLLIDDSIISIADESPIVEPPKPSIVSPVAEKLEVPVKSPVIEKRIPIKEPEVQIKKSTRQKKPEVKKDEPKKQMAKIVVPVKRPNTVEKRPLVKSQSKKEERVTKSSAAVKKAKSVQQEVQKSPVKPVEVPVQKKSFSETYMLYKSSVDNQVKYISMQLKSFTNNFESFIEKLPEEAQSKVHQTIQQGQLLINEKAKSFEDVLDKHENGDPSDPRRVTDDDVENYWSLLFDQIQEFKNDLQYVKEAKTFAMKNERKRKTMSETPSRRSRRIAECKNDTPKHNSSTCFGCTPLSASKINTPKSAKKRRATFKKSIAFDQATER